MFKIKFVAHINGSHTPPEKPQKGDNGFFK